MLVNCSELQQLIYMQCNSSLTHIALADTFPQMSKYMHVLGYMCIYIVCQNIFHCRNNLIATAGATQGLSMLGHLLFSPGDLVFVENPTYFIAIRMLEHDAGFKCVPCMQVTDVQYVLSYCVSCFGSVLLTTFHISPMGI